MSEENVVSPDDLSDPAITYEDGSPGWSRDRPANPREARYTVPESVDGSKAFQEYSFQDYAKAILEAAGLDRKTFQWLASLSLPRRYKKSYRSVEPPVEQADPYNILVERWKVKPHDLFEIASLSVPGRVHRLFCGDANDWDESRYACGHGWPPLMITEPPYPYTWQKGDPPDFSEAFRNFYGLSAYIFTPPCSVHVAGNQILASRMALANMLAIRCPRLRQANHRDLRRIRDDWVAVWCCTREGGKPKRVFSNFWNEIESTVDLPQDTLKIQPWVNAAVYAQLIANHGLVGSIVFDPFAGTGTALLAAEATRNVAYLIDNNPQAVAVILERASLLGMKPKRVHKRIIRAPATLPYITRSKRRIAVPVGPPILADGQAPRRAGREIRNYRPEDRRSD